ncbi:hypothetical protein [Okibacterium fritillariae]|uniref:Uncharacterized protein n=1 Tax=Okibacterium fritillariae TaxID=123320 RepID=A0A1T5IZV8_9MICO|nr:hypothetical protein [Okibacterium fritillariae]SKC44725.1 hypothetical protein SAMN06309945_1065 [Okibacterium fritillariae]
MTHALTAAIRDAAYAAVSPTPSPTPTLKVDPDQVTPGIFGFLVPFLVVVVVVLLIVDMVRRIRRATYRGEIAERLADEVAAREEAERTGQTYVAPDERSHASDENGGRPTGDADDDRFTDPRNR